MHGNGEFCIFGEIGYIAMFRCFRSNGVELTAAVPPTVPDLSLIQFCTLLKLILEDCAISLP